MSAEEIGILDQGQITYIANYAWQIAGTVDKQIPIGEDGNIVKEEDRFVETAFRNAQPRQLKQDVIKNQVYYVLFINKLKQYFLLHDTYAS